MSTVTAFREGEELVFSGGPAMSARPGAGVVVTRGLYSDGRFYIDVAWIDEMRNGQHDGQYEACFFRRPAKIIPFKR